MKVELKVTNGAMKGKTFEFTEHDTFLFGRSQNAKCQLPDDNYVSRNHFLLEINPPKVWLRDLGSLNGTYVNNIKYGGREVNEAPKPAMNDFSVFINKNLVDRSNYETELFNDDHIKVGDTLISVIIESDVNCKKCGNIIDSADKEKYRIDQNNYLCEKCEKQDIEQQADQTLNIKAKKKVDNKVQDENKKNREADKFVADFIMQLLGDVNVGKPKIIQTFPDYEVIKKLGEGGMGAVYMAKDIKNGNHVAIKIIKPDNKPNEKEISRFKREGELNYSLKHRNIVSCYKTDFADGIYYIVMEFIDGIDIQTLLQQKGKIDIQTACKIIIDALDGMEYMHKNNVVHRDIKPPNILLLKDGTNWIPKIADFGLAKNLKSSSSITAKGDVAGSIPYLPPEQIFDFKNIKPVSDIFSIGATLYTMICGQLVHDYPREKDPFLINIQVPSIPIEKRLPGIPIKIAQVINRSVAFNANERIQTAKQLQEELRKAIN